MLVSDLTHKGNWCHHW